MNKFSCPKYTFARGKDCLDRCDIRGAVSDFRKNDRKTPAPAANEAEREN